MSFWLIIYISQKNNIIVERENKNKAWVNIESTFNCRKLGKIQFFDEQYKLSSIEIRRKLILNTVITYS